MYIPLPLRSDVYVAAAPGSPRSTAAADVGIADWTRVRAAAVAAPVHTWLRRQFSKNAGENKNIQIGIAVGVVLGVFLIAACAFLWIYRGSVKFRSRKKRRGRHKTTSSRSSGSSKASDGGLPPPEPEPEPEP